VWKDLAVLAAAGRAIISSVGAEVDRIESDIQRMNPGVCTTLCSPREHLQKDAIPACRQWTGAGCAAQ